jgi:predicted acyl esterase
MPDAAMPAPPKREQFTREVELRGETITRIYAKELKPVTLQEWQAMSPEQQQLAKPYPFNQRTYEAAPGIICEQDVAVKMRDGVELYCDIFRPDDDSEKIPAILAWSNYGKRPNEYREGDDIAYTPGVPAGTVSPLAKFEAVDPMFWCYQGYAVINVDIRGIGFSGGFHDQFGSQAGMDGYDFIEWTAVQPWCNGRVTMAGSSALAMDQWQVAAQQPPHLACIAPSEGTADLYRESVCEGGIPAASFTNFATAGACGLNGIDDQGAMVGQYPLINAYWEDKIADWSKITVPVYATAGWNHFHLRGTIMAFRNLGTKDKWLRAHREFEWPDFYEAANQAELKLFFDRYCKDIHNGWERTPHVRIDVMDAFDQDHELRRAEDEFPLARTTYRKLYLDAASLSMQDGEVAAESSASYDSESTGPEGELDFDYVFKEDTELTGYMKLHAFVEADGHDDMDLFITIKKFDASGIELPITIFSGTAPHPGAWGKMRVSHRELDQDQSSDFQPIQAHKHEYKLSPGEIVPIDVEINPFSRIWHAGEILRVQIAARYIRDPHWIEPLFWDTDNHGRHIVHTGGAYQSFLQVPVVGPKHPHDKPFVVDTTKHPTHPIF